MLIQSRKKLFPLYITKTFLFLSILLILLNPYTAVGPIGYYVLVPFLFFGIASKSFSFFLNKHMLSIVGIILIGFYGWFVSLINNISQTNHLDVSLSVVIMMFVSLGIWDFSSRHDIDFKNLLLMILVADSKVKCNRVATVMGPEN